MANEDKLHNLARELLSATRDGRLAWEAPGTSGTSNWFQVGLPSGAVILNSSEGTEPYFLTVYDDKGNLIESLRSEYEGGIGKPMPWNDTLTELWQAARHQALNIDEVLESILKDVSSGPPEDDDIPF